jgi:hypothetical protein
VRSYGKVVLWLILFFVWGFGLGRRFVVVRGGACFFGDIFLGRLILLVETSGFGCFEFWFDVERGILWSF